MALSVRDEAIVQELLRRSDGLDDRSFEVIFVHYKDRLVRYAASQGANDPEGVAHQAMFDAYRAFNRTPIRDEPAFRQYLYRATRSHTIGERRRRTPEPVEPTDRADPAGDHTADVVDQLWLDDLVGSLPEAQRTVIEHRFYDDLPVRQAADLLDRGEGAVHQLQHRAIRRLRRLAGVAVVAAIAITGALVWWALSRQVSTVDTEPIEQRPTTTVLDPDRTDRRATTSTPGATDRPLVVGPSIGGTAVEEPQPPADGTSTTTGSATSSPAITADTTGPGSKPTPPVSATTTVTGGGPSPTGPTGPTVSTAPTVDPAVAALQRPVSDLNRCVISPVGEIHQAFQLYDPRGSAQAAESFEPPGAILLVPTEGDPVVVDIDAHPSRLVGWTTVGSTLALPLPSAPDPQRVWTVAVESRVSSWEAVYYLDGRPGRPVWTDPGPCGPASGS